MEREVNIEYIASPCLVQLACYACYNFSVAPFFGKSFQKVSDISIKVKPSLSSGRR